MNDYIGQIEIFSFNFAPRGWAPCNGQLLSINQNQALFSLIGTTFGGDGRSTFALPNLQGNVAVGQGTGPGLPPVAVGQIGGEINHTLTVSETPQHTHRLMTAAKAVQSNSVDAPSESVTLSATTGTEKETTFPVPLYVADPAPAQALATQAVGPAGGQPHANTMPSLAVGYFIATQGVFPSRS
jgi:microcystin-dependent protein